MLQHDVGTLDSEARSMTGVASCLDFVDADHRDWDKAMLVSVVQVLQDPQGIVTGAVRPMDVWLLLLD